MKFEVTVGDILDMASDGEKDMLFEDLVNAGHGKDVEDMVDDATTNEKRRIFDQLWEEGFGEDYIEDYVRNNRTTAIETKRFMMDKHDEYLLEYLIEKYKYFG
jgi:hypothetical protein